MIAVFEPRSATSRRKVFQKDYVEAFLGSDLAFFASPFDQSKIAEADRFSIDELIQDIKNKKHHAVAKPTVDELLKEILKETKAGDVIILMSNGGFDNIYQKIMKALDK